MKTHTCKIWRDIAMIGAVEAVVFGGFWLLLNTYYSERLPAPVKAWAPVVLFIVTSWFLIAHRLKHDKR